MMYIIIIKSKFHYGVETPEYCGKNKVENYNICTLN